jgi:hypothetical protein
MGTLWSTGCCEIAAAMIGTTGVLAAPEEPELQPDVPSTELQIAAIASANLGRAENLLAVAQSLVCIWRSFAAFLSTQCRMPAHPSLVLEVMQLRQSQFQSVAEHSRSQVL